jgi:hypothetical protein
MLYAVAKGMYQNIIALHAANGMLDEDADLAQNLIGYLLWKVGDVSEVLVCYSLGVYETQSNSQATRVIV